MMNLKRIKKTLWDNLTYDIFIYILLEPKWEIKTSERKLSVRMRTSRRAVRNSLEILQVNHLVNHSINWVLQVYKVDWRDEILWLNHLVNHKKVDTEKQQSEFKEEMRLFFYDKDKWPLRMKMYVKDLRHSFYNYRTEADSKWRIRKSLQKIWDLDRRMITRLKNELKKEKMTYAEWKGKCERAL